MDLHSADSLASFINNNGTRFHASVFDFSDKGWVIVAEKLENGGRRIYSEPIADVSHFLRRVADGLLQIDPEYLRLLTAWQESCGERKMPEMVVGVSRITVG